MQKKIMICGAGLGQVDAILEAKKMGLYVLVVDMNAEAPGMKLADHSEAINTTDKDACMDFAKKHAIDGIITLQSDIAVPTVGYINDKLNLTGVSFETAQRCSNKILMRQYIANKNVLQPNFKVVTNVEEAIEACKKISFPCVIKAPDSSGSRGITKVKNETEVSSAVAEAFKHTKSKQILVEEYIKGTEYGAQTFSYKGKCHSVLIHDDELSPPPYMIPIAHSFPCSIDESKLEKIKQTIAASVEALGIEDGPANIDFILDEEGNAKIVEIGARMGATCLPELIYFHSGINWIAAAIKVAIGEKPNLETNKNVAVSAYIISSPNNGIIQEIKWPAEIKDKNVIDYNFTAKDGDIVSSLKKGTDRIGKVITIGDSVPETIQLAKKILKNIEFKFREVYLEN